MVRYKLDVPDSRASPCSMQVQLLHDLAFNRWCVSKSGEATYEAQAATLYAFQSLCSAKPQTLPKILTAAMPRSYRRCCSVEMDKGCISAYDTHRHCMCPLCIATLHKSGKVMPESGRVIGPYHGTSDESRYPICGTWVAACVPQVDG